MNRKGTKYLEGELKTLKLLFDANPDFDYASRAEIARRAQGIVREASTISRARPGDIRAREVHCQALELFHKAVTGAYPKGFSEAYERLKAGDSTGLATAVKFLEADPWFVGSGYTKADLIRYISHIELPRDIAERLRRVVVAVVDRRDRREYRQYCRLARKVDSPELREELSLRLQHDDPAVRRRARWALDACEKPG